jgi:hypothetical protein
MILWITFDLNDGRKHASQGYVASPSAKMLSSIQTIDNGAEQT